MSHFRSTLASAVGAVVLTATVSVVTVTAATAVVDDKLSMSLLHWPQPIHIQWLFVYEKQSSFRDYYVHEPIMMPPVTHTHMEA